MTNSILKISMLALITVAISSCKENKEVDTAETMEVMEATEAATAYTVDVAASEITWKGKKPMTTHHGTVDLSSGNFSLNNGVIEAGTFTMDMTTITDLDLEGDSKAKLEGHLKGTAPGKENDFFNVPEFKTSVFALTGISEVNGKTIINGNLTIKDKTNPVEFPATITTDAQSMTIKSEPFMIDRTKWGVNYGSKTVFDNLGDKFVDDNVEITVLVVANKA